MRRAHDPAVAGAEQAGLRNRPEAHRDRITRGQDDQARGVVPLVGRIDDRFYPGVEKSLPGSPVELRWSEGHYSSEALAAREAQTMAMLAAEEGFIQVTMTSRSVASADGQHKGHFVVGSRLEKGVRVFYCALQCTDWGQPGLGAWGDPLPDLQQAEQRAQSSLEGWRDAMDNFADCMIPPGAESGASPDF